ncbi:MAG: hypothetical protein ACRD0V_09550, partial [Acidimicrobiales bacterium]
GGQTMSYFSKRALRWAAPVALVGALGLAACGDNDDSVALRAAAPSAAGLGSDQHLSNQAKEIARASASVGSDQHLINQAEEIARASELAGEQRAYQAASAKVTAQAEQVEWSAHLEGQANTYSGTDVPTNSDANLPNAFEAGNRAALMAQAEAYVEQQQDRAESSSYEGEFLPGGHHVSSR